MTGMASRPHLTRQPSKIATSQSDTAFLSASAAIADAYSLAKCGADRFYFLRCFARHLATIDGPACRFTTPQFHFGSDCMSITELPAVPAALAGLIARPLPAGMPASRPLQALPDVPTGTAKAKAALGLNAVSPHKGLRWRVTCQHPAERNGLPACDALADSTPWADAAEQWLQQTASFIADCLAHRSCETRVHSRSIGADALAPIRRTKQLTAVWGVLGGVLWPMRVSVVAQVDGWPFKRWFHPISKTK
ncbi:hypothetical protein AAGS40_26115 (plasmid) [Paraburkholderia sp. PREW-6R]|uniref:hypothetical protein n=1 Tax=Paraburkholderia sp. PREW-6R TaxID=3141544 RepID=UPI0031F5C4B5